MALLFADSFDGYSAAADFSYRYSVAGSPTLNTTGGVVSGAKWVQFDNAQALTTNIRLDITTNRIRIAFWLYMEPLSASLASNCIELSSSTDSTLHWAFGFTSGSVAYITRFDDALVNSAAAVGGFGATVLDTGQWYHIEIEFVSGDSTAGVAKLWIDGVLDINLAAGDTNAAVSPNQFQDLDTLKLLGQSGQNNSFAVDDLVVWDDVGTAFTGQLGRHRMECLRPNAAGDSADFTPSSGSNYAAVDDTGPDGDATYVQSGTSGHKDLYNYGAMATSPLTIKGVVVTAIVKNTDVGSIGMRNLVKSGSTTVNGATKTLDFSSYKPMQEMFAVDPNTSAAWTITGVDAAQFGLEVV